MSADNFHDSVLEVPGIEKYDCRAKPIYQQAWMSDGVFVVCLSMPVVDFVREAANDPNVLAIKQTLYRVNPRSPIIDALMEARVNGKQVAVLVELKARFDEENNIEWARKLEDEGVHVIYGVRGLKTHTKVCLVIRRDTDGIRRYVHLGTGNYNVVSSRIYTDLSYFTCDPVIGTDVSDLFNALTGYSRKIAYARLLVAPTTLRREMIERIDREIHHHREHASPSHTGDFLLHSLDVRRNPLLLP